MYITQYYLNVLSNKAEKSVALISSCQIGQYNKQRMFNLCYAATPLSPKGETEKVHFNPIYRKLGGKKKSKNKKAEIKTAQTCMTNQSIIYGCALSNSEQTSRHARTSSELVQSVCLHGNLQNGQSRINSQKFKEQVEDSKAKSLQKQLKYSRLQDKYINVLERANQYLQKTLKSKEKYEQKSRSKSKCIPERKVSTELQELKNRLNNIDLSGINKLAKFRMKTQNQDLTQKEGKQNKNYSAFKELRFKIA